MKHPPQEHDVVPGRAIASIGIGVVIATVVCAVIAYEIGARSSRYASEAATFAAGATDRGARRLADASGIERTPFAIEAQGLAQQARAARTLSSYGWVDRQREIVHVPIAVAIDLYVARRGAQR